MFKDDLANTSPEEFLKPIDIPATMELSKKQLMYLRISAVNDKILRVWFDMYHPLPVMKGDRSWNIFGF